MPKPEPAVVRVLREYKLALLNREQAQMAELAQRWLGVEQRLAAQMELLAREIAEMRANGQVVTQGKLLRMERYRDLLAQVQQEVTGYTQYAKQTITTEQARWVQLSLEAAQEAIGAGYVEAARVVPSFNRLDVGAAENLIAWSSKGAPLRTLLEATYPDAVDGMTQALINGAALGWNPVKTAREMRNGTALGLDRSLVIARDQQMRAARASVDAQYQASGLVKFKRRLVAKDLRTCLACLARDGERIPVDQPGYDHTCGRCSWRPELEGVPEIPYQTTSEWFQTLDPAAQRSMLGDARYEAWKAGKFKFGDLAVTTEHQVWGQGLQIRSLKELLSATVAHPAPQISAALPRVPDFTSDENQLIAHSPDMRAWYPKGEPGSENLRPLPVMLNGYGISHLQEDHPERLQWLRDHAVDVRRIVENPEVVYPHLVFKDRMGHWSQALSGPIAGPDGEYMLVVLSLGNLPGQEGSEWHQVITVHPQNKRQVYDKRTGELKPRWMLAGKQKAGD